MTEILKGIRVVELGTMITAPLVGLILGDFGADVVKVERPDGGDPFRSFRGGLYSPHFIAFNRNKRSVALDLQTDAGKASLRALLAEADVLVPVPLHWKRGWSRRYNQSGALARVIGRQTGVKLSSEALRRVRPTQQQIGLSRKERASNVQGAFKVAADRQHRIQGRRVVLVDDVLTSGATVDACARALLRAKAASVDVLVFARVVDTHKSPI